MFIMFDRNSVFALAANVYTVALLPSPPQNLCLHAVFYPQKLCQHGFWKKISVSMHASHSSATHWQSLEHRIHSFSTYMHFQLKASFNVQVVMTTMSAWCSMRLGSVAALTLLHISTALMQW